jgi:soluble lytic murein transglycosylase-like protein
MIRHLPNTLIVLVSACFLLTSFQWAPPNLKSQAQDLKRPFPSPSLLVPRPVIPFDELINDAAHENHLDPLLLQAIISVESGFDPDSLSQAGACGLTQLMPATGKLFGIHHIYDPKENIEVGAHHFRNLLERYSQNLALSLAAYNAGEEPVTRYHGIPPYPETEGYVRQVLVEYTRRSDQAAQQTQDARTQTRRFQNKRMPDMTVHSRGTYDKRDNGQRHQYDEHGEGGAG